MSSNLANHRVKTYRLNLKVAAIDFKGFDGDRYRIGVNNFHLYALGIEKRVILPMEKDVKKAVEVVPAGKIDVEYNGNIEENVDIYLAGGGRSLSEGFVRLSCTLADRLKVIRGDTIILSRRVLI